VKHWRQVADDEITPLEPFMKIADENPQRTPLYVFVDFCSFSKEDPEDFTITRDDALRYFSSAFHFDHIIASLNPLAIFDPPAHMVAHMLLPVKAAGPVSGTGAPGGGDFLFYLKGHTVRFRHVVVPPSIEIMDSDTLYAFHFGSILTIIDQRQKKMIEAHLLRIEGFRTYLDRVKEIDYLDYQSFGNYHDHIIERYERNGFL
jgi:hypothetical protein